VPRTPVVALAMALMLTSAASAAAAQGPPPGAAPRVLNVVRTRLKPQTSGPYAALEAQIVRAYDRARARVFWICLQSSKDANDILYLNLHESTGAADQMAAAYQDTIKRHPEIVSLQERLAELTLSTDSTLTTRRDDIDRAPSSVDFATMRNVRVTMIQVRPGREGDFVKALRTATPKDGAWLVYEANDSSTFFLMTLKRTKINRKDGPAIPRALRRSTMVYLKADTRAYSVRPQLSRVSQAFVAANPQLWRGGAAGGNSR
jgi:hypothetical protein